MRAHVFKVNLLLLEKLQSFVNILQAVDAHTAFGWPWLWEIEQKKEYIKWSNSDSLNLLSANNKKEKEI